MEEKLTKLKLNQKAIVKSVDEKDSGLLQKLTAMGVTKGVEVSIVKKSFFGDPIEIKVRGFALSLRKNEAEAVLVEA